LAEALEAGEDGIAAARRAFATDLALAVELPADDA
jgi:hypothetical protein